MSELFSVQQPPALKSFQPLNPPSLAEIAALPFPASRIALNRYFGPPLINMSDVGGRASFTCRVRFEYRETGSQVVTIEAENQEEAMELAEDQIDADFDVVSFLDVEILEVEALTH